MEIEYAPTVDDDVAFQMYVYDHSPTLQKQQRTAIRIVCLTWLALSWIILLPLTLAERDDSVFFGVALCAASIAILILYTFCYHMFADMFRSRVKKNARRVFKEPGATSATPTPIRLVITTESIDTSSQHGASSVLWPAITSIVSAKNHAFLFMGPAHACIVPKRAFRDEWEFEKFVETARGYWELANQNSPK